MRFAGHPTIYRGGDQTGKVRHLPDPPAFRYGPPLQCRYRGGAPGLKMAVRFPARRSLPPRERPEDGRYLAAGVPDRVAGRHSAPNPAFDPLRTVTAISPGAYSRSRPGSPAIRRSGDPGIRGSGDPAMNWACPSLGDYRLAAHSDAHSPGAEVRGPREFSAAPDFFSLASAREPAWPGGRDRLLSSMMDKRYLDCRRKYGVHFAGGTAGEHDGSRPEYGKTLMIGQVYRVTYRGWPNVSVGCSQSDTPRSRIYQSGAAAADHRRNSRERPAEREVDAWASPLTADLERELGAFCDRPRSEIGLARAGRRARCPAGSAQPRSGPPCWPPGAGYGCRGVKGAAASACCPGCSA
jgi:hypothetical protein